MSDGNYAPEPLAARLAAAARRRGVRPVAGDFARWATRLAAGLPHTRVGAHGEFSLDGERYPYRYGLYKRSWLTERAVEVPVAQRIVDRYAGARVLEVGNVLSHYAPQCHLIVDKYERADGVLNRDVLELDDLGEFDLVITVSTIEHVGWDEEPRAPWLALEAIRSLERRLAPGGRLMLTVPAGYNSALDEALRTGAVAFTRQAGLLRVGGGTHWRQVPPYEIWSAPYDFLLYAARGVLIAELERSAA